MSFINFQPHFVSIKTKKKLKKRKIYPVIAMEIRKEKGFLKTIRQDTKSKNIQGTIGFEGEENEDDDPKGSSETNVEVMDIWICIGRNKEYQWFNCSKVDFIKMK